MERLSDSDMVLVERMCYTKSERWPWPPGKSMAVIVYQAMRMHGSEVPASQMLSGIVVLYRPDRARVR